VYASGDSREGSCGPVGVEVVGDEDAPAVRIHDPVQDAGTIPHQVPQASGAVDHHEALDLFGPLHGNPEGRPDPAARPVRRQHVAAAHLVARIRGEVSDERGDACFVRLRGLPLVLVVEIGALLQAQELQQERLEEVLGDVQERGRRGR
jgi:hypothetical protein